MAQSLFDALTENQTEVAVQSLLESQTVADTPVEDEDLFQCGKCKKQFTSLPAFVSHKGQRCTGLVASLPTLAPSTSLGLPSPGATLTSLGPVTANLGTLGAQTATLTPLGNGTTSLASLCTVNSGSNNAFTTTVPIARPLAQQLTTYQAMPTSPLPTLGQGMVLSSEDLLALTGITDQALQGSTIQMVTTPFVNPSGVKSGNLTILSSTTTTAGFSGNGGNMTFASTMPAGSVQVVPAPQQITFTIPEPATAKPTILGKTGSGRPGRRAAASSQQEAVVAVVEGASSTTPGVIRLQRRTKLASVAPDDCAAKRKLRCQYCDKTFAKNFDLQQHIRAHTGEKPFQCIVCGRAFAQKSNVKKHMATHKVWPSGAGTTLPKQPDPEYVMEEQGHSDPGSLPDPLEQVPEPGVEQMQECSEASLPHEGRTFLDLSGAPCRSTHQMQECSETALPQEGEEDGLCPDGGEEGGEGGGEVEGEVDGEMEGEMEGEVEGEVDGEGDGEGEGETKMRVVVDNSYVCQYCPAKYKTYFQLKSHMVQHKAQQVYKCVMKSCGQTFKDLDAFLEHTKTHENEMTYRCHMCNKYFPSLYELGVHQYSHSLYPNQGPKPGPRHFQCTKCMNKYSTPEALEHHMSSTTHNYPCPHCPKTFTCERYLRRHLPTHGTEGQFQCPTCQKKFKTDHYLKMHMLIHTGEKPFPCELCEAAFNRKDKLKRHLLIHETNKKYRCPFKSLTGCVKEFNRPDKLKAHIITHSGIKPFKCRDCGKGFSRRPHLLEHERGHRADYKFRCPSCGKGFFRPKLFNEHKCQPPREGSVSQVFRPRHRRKVGRPRKRMIKVTQELLKEGSGRVYNPRSRHREARSPRLQALRAAQLAAEQAAAVEAQNQAESVAMETETSQSSSGLAAVAVSEAEGMDGLETGKLTGLTAEGMVKLEGLEGDQAEGLVSLTTAKLGGLDGHGEGGGVVTLTPARLAELTGGAVTVPESLVDHYVVQLTEMADGVHTTFLPASSAQVVAGGPPITIIEGSMLAGGEGGHGEGMVATQVVVTSSDGGTTFVACPAQLVEYTPGTHDALLQEHHASADLDKADMLDQCPTDAM